MKYLLSENQKIFLKKKDVSAWPFYDSGTHSYKKELASYVITLKVIHKIS